MRNRGKRSIKVYFSVDGAQIAGSLMDVESFNYKPEAKIDELVFLGDPETQYETDVKGHGFDFVHLEKDQEGAKIWDTIVEKYTTGQAQPTIVMTVLTDYIDPSVANRTEVFSKVAMKVDSVDMGDGYVKRKWSGMASSYKKF